MDTKTEKGRATLTAILGDAYVDKRSESTNNFNAPLRELTDQYCFADIWSNPTLPLKTRSMIVIALLAAMGRSTELRTHLNGGLNLGCTPEELREVLLHVGAYSGIPAAVEATRVAVSVLEERGLLNDVSKRS